MDESNEAGQGVPTGLGAGPPLMGPPPDEIKGAEAAVSGPPWWQRRWLVVALVGATVLLLATAVAQAVWIVNLSNDVAAGESRLGVVRDSNRELRASLRDRNAQREADQAAASRLEAERLAAEREDAQKEAAEKAAEEAARLEREAEQAEAVEREAEAAERRQQQEQELRNTMPGDGIVSIGPEKNAGTYRTDGPDRSGSCYYAVLNAPSGPGISNIITNNNIRGPGIVVVSDGQFFESSGCQSWKRQ